MTYDLIVVGGGISGLTTAFYARRAGLRVLLLEASLRLGGAISTLQQDGWLFELGPNTVLEKHASVAALIHDAGLDARKLVANPAAKRRYLYKGHGLVALPAGPIGFLRTPLFSARAKLGLLREPFIKPPADGREESVADFVRRRLGTEMLDYAVGPFVSGVFAGDPERLSVRWAVPKIAALESQHGSLIRGALARRKGPAPGGAMVTLDRGLTVLVEALGASCGEVLCEAGCETVTPQQGAFTVTLRDGRRFDARQVVLAAPADAAARLLREALPEARELDEIPYAAVAVVSLGLRQKDVTHPLDGFGFLAPRKEPLRLLGCLFPSSFFSGRAPQEHVALTAVVGGRSDPEIVSWEQERIVTCVLDELRPTLGLRAAPVFVRLERWPRAIAQYEVGHGRFVELAARIERARPGLYFGGSFLHGVSVPDCIDNAVQLTQRVLQRQALSRG